MHHNNSKQLYRMIRSTLCTLLMLCVMGTTVGSYKHCTNTTYDTSSSLDLPVWITIQQTGIDGEQAQYCLNLENTSIQPLCEINTKECEGKKEGINQLACSICKSEYNKATCDYVKCDTNPDPVCFFYDSNNKDALLWISYQDTTLLETYATQCVENPDIPNCDNSYSEDEDKALGVAKTICDDQPQKNCELFVLDTNQTTIPYNFKSAGGELTTNPNMIVYINKENSELECDDQANSV